MKKAIFFTTDALIASGILITAVLLANNMYSHEIGNDDVLYASNDALGLLASSSVATSKNQYVLENVQNGTIHNLNNSLLIQIGEFWTYGKKDIAGNMTLNLTSEIFPETFSYSVEIAGDIVYMKNLSYPKVLANSKTIISGIKGLQYWGPYVAEVKVWH